MTFWKKTKKIRFRPARQGPGPRARDQWTGPMGGPMDGPRARDHWRRPRARAQWTGPTGGPVARTHGGPMDRAQGPRALCICVRDTHAGGRRAGGRDNSTPTGVYPHTQDCFPVLRGTNIQCIWPLGEMPTLEEGTKAIGPKGHRAIGTQGRWGTMRPPHRAT